MLSGQQHARHTYDCGDCRGNDVVICLPRHATPRQVRNELTSAEFALNLNGAMWTGSGTAEATFSSTPTSGGIINGEATSTSGPSASSASSSSSSVVTTPAAGSKTEIDYDSIAERLEASLRALQAGRPLSLREAVTEDEVRQTRQTGR